MEQMVRMVLRLPEDQALLTYFVPKGLMERQGSSDLQTHWQVERMEFARRQAQHHVPDLAHVSPWE